MIDFSSDRFIKTPVLNIGYGDYGDGSGFPIMLLHGFPYDVRSWDGVVPPLVEAGFRVLVPYIRGYGSTSFLDPAAPKMAEQAAIAQDVVDFAEALGISQFAMAGFDWGNRAACITSGSHRRLLGSEHDRERRTRFRSERSETLVSVVLQYRTGESGSGKKPQGYSPSSVGILGAQVGIHR